MPLYHAIKYRRCVTDEGEVVVVSAYTDQFHSRADRLSEEVASKYLENNYKKFHYDKEKQIFINITTPEYKSWLIERETPEYKAWFAEMDECEN